MKHKDFGFNGASRSNQRAKRRKTNLILNSLIVIVLLLIIIVSFSIFFGSGDEGSSTEVSNKNIESQNNEEETTAENESSDDKNSSEEQGSYEESSTVGQTNDSESDTDLDEASSDDYEVTQPDTEDVVSDGGSDPNVKTTITNPDWQPVGTVQQGEHAPVYDSNSTDWQEMIKAISYGTGIDQNNMTVWFLGNSGTENQSVGTVSTKDQSVTYRVFIEWVDGQGWKPTKVEELLQNDQR